MHTRFLARCLGIFPWLLALAFAQNSPTALGPGVPDFKVRPGYHVDLVAQNIGEVRFIEFGPQGDLYVSQPRTGAIITLRLKDGTWQKIADFTTGKPTAHGMHYFDGWLWFTQSGAVWKARDTDGDGKADEEIKITDDLPSGGGHWWRSILVTPQGFYTSIGDSGNLTDETATERQKIWRFNLDGSGKTLFASGLRNTEKLRLRPGTQEIWGADHGSDNYGQLLGERQGVNQPFTDRIPPCEFNHYTDGGFYGHPFIVGPGLPRLEFKDRPDFLELAKKTIPPEWCFGAHWAPNGWNFMESRALGLQGDAVVACHGSWNSTVRVGYRLERLLFDPVTNKIMGSQALVTLITDDGKVLGRPCDVAEAADGSLYFSDDSRGVIYRLTIDTGIATAGAATATPGVVIPPTLEADGLFHPLTFFQGHCARCHGDYGVAYGPQFVGKLADPQLRQKVTEMTLGPAQSPLTSDQMSKLLVFLRSLRDTQPYGFVVSYGKDGLVKGEASPGASVWLISQGQKKSIPLKNHSWEVRVSTGSDARILVQKDGKEVWLTLRPADA